MREILCKISHSKAFLDNRRIPSHKLSYPMHYTQYIFSVKHLISNYVYTLIENKHQRCTFDITL